jgi:hypothetical protein
MDVKLEIEKIVKRIVHPGKHWVRPRGTLSLNVAADCTEAAQRGFAIGRRSVAEELRAFADKLAETPEKKVDGPGDARRP